MNFLECVMIDVEEFFGRKSLKYKIHCLFRCCLKLFEEVDNVMKMMLMV